MRIAVIFLCTLYFACTLSRADKFGDIITCIQEMDLKLENVLSLMNDETAEGKQQYGCLLACVLQKKDAMVGNTFKISVIENYIAKFFDNDDEKETMLQHINHCISQAENDDECVAARQFIDCSKEHLDHMDLRKVLEKVTIA
ncbi:uncharacterized protein LOC122534663 [Frieseomelitta varia]|uniref:uncharacterized protein LOC122534663 n=1 Tax=Frieseomelitta varia TaxID=561572 RepID=UPI001CB67DA2|nr:uncharacterized protein LOC122534663 [Frieseomelitta varia]